MENYASEIGQKMRSAVKAKLLELGTGGSAAYIDDELPDYVMIMVANKRSKQQMSTDLNLFLGSQTELFVTWLHEVLQKLQEVTLPSSSSSNKKRKSHHNSAEPVGKKDKKVHKSREKKNHGKNLENIALNTPEPDKPTTTTIRATEVVATPTIQSITDVFAEELLEKAKKALDVTANTKEEIKKKKKSISETNSHINNLSDEFNIPTMTEITSTTGSNCKDITFCSLGSDADNICDVALLNDNVILNCDREKDLAELAEIQKKIYVAKMHLRETGELNDGESLSDDADFLKLKDDDDVGQEEDDNFGIINQDSKKEKTLPKKAKSPIVFTKSLKSPERDQHGKNLQPNHKQHRIDFEHLNVKSKISEKKAKHLGANERRPVHERLGHKTLDQNERRSRQAKELYVPAHRRREQENEKQRSSSHDKTRQKQRDQSKESSRTREKERERNERSKSLASKRRASTPDERHQHHLSSKSHDDGTNSVKQRVVSRVIKAPNKPLISPLDMEDKSINSVIKIKPRPTVAPHKQASTNLLLRAVADAQRSTISASTTEKKKREIENAMFIKNSFGDKLEDPKRSGELYTKSYRERERLKLVEPNREHFRRKARNLVVEVALQNMECVKPQPHDVDVVIHEEYVPEMIIEGEDSQTNYDPYVPQSVKSNDKNENDYDIAIIEPEQKDTQFVVTLHGEKLLKKYKKRTSSMRRRSVSPHPHVSSSVGMISSSVDISAVSKSNISNRRQQPEKKNLHLSRARNARTPSYSSTSSNTPPPQTTRNLRRSDAIRQKIEIKKIIIQNDTDEEDEICLKKAVLQKYSTSDFSNGYSKNEKIVNNVANQQKSNNNSNNEKVFDSDGITTPPLPIVKKSSNRSAEKRKCQTGTNANSDVDTNNVDVGKCEATNVAKSKHTPIKYIVKEKIDGSISPKRSRSNSDECARAASLERRKISIRTSEDKKYDNIPSLSSVAVDSIVMKVVKAKERCKYHPNCTKQFCDYYHPTAPCKSFPNCKFADKCLYAHPKCKFDLLCMSVDCNYAHSGTRDLSHAQLTAPPLSSHVIPVQNYKSITATAPTSCSATMCKYYPNCSKTGCAFFHPKACRYGKNCVNKLECSFYHAEMQSSNKFKWVASIV